MAPTHPAALIPLPSTLRGRMEMEDDDESEARRGEGAEGEEEPHTQRL